MNKTLNKYLTHSQCPIVVPYWRIRSLLSFSVCLATLLTISPQSIAQNQTDTQSKNLQPDRAENLSTTLPLSNDASTDIPIHTKPYVSTYSPRPSDPRGRLSQQQVILLTMQHNPVLQASLMQLKQADETVRLEQAHNPFTLQLNAGATYDARPIVMHDGYSTAKSTTIDAGAQLTKTFTTGTQASLRFENSGGKVHTPDASGPTYNMSARASVVQPLMRGAGTDVGEQRIRIAKIQRTTAQLSRNRTASEAARDVLLAYWDLWYAEVAINIEQSARALALRQRDEALQRVHDGALAPVEVLPFETRLASLEESVISAGVQRRSRSLTLSQRIGDDKVLGTSILVRLDDRPSASATPSRIFALQQALAHSPEIKELESQLHLAQQQLQTSGDNLRARLDLQGYVQVAGIGNRDVGAMLEQVAAAKATSAHVGIVYELPLNSSLHAATRARDRLAVNIARQHLVAARQRIQTEIDTLLEQHKSAKVRLELAEKTAKIAEMQVQAETERYQIGVAIAVQVQQAEDELRRARLRTERARVDVAQAQVQLQHATGQLLRQVAEHLSSATPGRR